MKGSNKMYKRLGKIMEMLEKGPTDKLRRELASYLMNVYGKENLYNQKIASDYVFITTDLTAQLVFIEDKEICTSCNIKYSLNACRDNLIFFVRKDFDSCTFKEKVMTICRIATTVLSYLLSKDDVGEMTKFYAQLVYSLLYLDSDKREEIVQIITEPFKQSQELLDDFDYMSKEICKMKEERKNDSTLYSLFNCGYIFKLANEAPKRDSKKESSDEDVKNS